MPFPDSWSPKSLNGSTGASGPTGVTGVSGNTGATGPTGTNGLDGKTVRYGAADPTATDGVDGDFWINTTSHFIFGPKASGTWPAGTSLVGPASSLPTEIQALFTPEFIPTSPDLWDDYFTGSSLNTTKWTNFNSPGSVTVGGGFLTITSPDADGTNTFRGIYCVPPSTTADYTIITSLRHGQVPEANYYDAGIGFVSGTTLYMCPVGVDYQTIDFWWGSWANGVPTYTSSGAIVDGLHGIKRIIRLDVTSTTVSIYVWGDGFWSLLKVQATSGYPSQIVLGIKRQNSAAGTNSCIVDWIRKG
jgi:hypothetical protein